MATDNPTQTVREADPSTGDFPAPGSRRPVHLGILFGAETHVGKVRPNNEDQFLVLRLSKSIDVLASSLPAEQCPAPLQRAGYVFLVADGMGGCAGGERASAAVVNATVEHLMETAKWFFRLDDPDDEVRLRLLREALARVDKQLVEAGQSDQALAGMGTTLTVASLIGDAAFLVHVGDSRTYLFRDGRLEQMTTDHTIVQEWVDRGMMLPEEARTHRLRHVLTNVIGGRLGVEGEVQKFRLADGDRILLCTDGLSDLVGDGEITGILARGHSAVETCRTLIDAALQQGGRDNVTVVVADCSIRDGDPESE